MIRTSNRKNAGSRRNKRIKFVPSRPRESFGWTFGQSLYDASLQWRVDRNPNHEARFANIADCFPLAGQRNLAKWKEL